MTASYFLERNRSCSRAGVVVGHDTHGLMVEVVVVVDSLCRILTPIATGRFHVAHLMAYCARAFVALAASFEAAEVVVVENSDIDDEAGAEDIVHGGGGGGDDEKEVDHSSEDSCCFDHTPMMADPQT